MNPWSVKEEQYLRAHYGKLTYAKIGKKLGRSLDEVKYKAHGMGLPWPGIYAADNHRDNAYMEKVRKEIYG